MNPVVSLYPPLSESSVEIIDIAEGVGNEEAFNVPDDFLNPPFFIWLAGIAGTNRKAIVPGEVHEPHIVCDHRLSIYNDRFQIVIGMPADDSTDLLEGLYMAVQKELHGTPPIEVGVKVPRIGQDVYEPIDYAEGHGPLHPIYLRFLVMVSSP